MPLAPALTAQPGDDAADARSRVAADPFGHLLLVDALDHPIGWLDPRKLPTSGTLETSMAVPMSPLLEPETTLKDALSMLLDADVQAGIAVDPEGRVLGLLTVDTIAGLLNRR